MSATLSRTTTHSMMEMRSFLAGADRGNRPVCGANCRSLQKAERAKSGVLDMETEVVTSLTAYGPAIHRRRIEGSGAGCWSADRQTAETCIHAVRRNQDG